MAKKNQRLEEAGPHPLDEHPRPRRARSETAPSAAIAAAAPEPEAAHQCTPTKIKKTGSNGDEERFKGADGKPSYIGNFSKGLPHDGFGEVNRAAYKSLLHALDAKTDFDKIVLGAGRKLTNPQAGLATDQEGPDPEDLQMLAAPSLDSAEEAAEGVELYWMALLRDVPFTKFDTDPGVAAAAAELSTLKDFTGPKIGGKVTPKTIFRGCEQGDLAGPLVSQFLLYETATDAAHRGIGYGAQAISQKMQTVLPGKEYLTKFDEWLNIQNGGTPATGDAFDPTPRYIRNMRDIGQWVHVDALYQAYLNACLVLLDSGAPFDPGNPYRSPHPDSNTQIGFGTFGGPHILSLVTEVATRALKAVWYQKWFVHRRLRPEAYGGLIQVKLAGVGGTKRDYPIDPQILKSEALKRTQAKFGSYLLPMAFPEGSPTHPAYGAGHATVAGACVTVLKAWFAENVRLVDLSIKPQVPNDDGTALVDYTGADAGSLTVGGELNKVAANIAIARNMAGVHWRSDYQQSILLGEQVALSILRKQRRDYNEKGWSFSLRRFDGTIVTISRKGIFDADGDEVEI
jgi:membrane-associated phospholipid phosphatase